MRILKLGFPQVTESLRYHLAKDSKATLAWAMSLPVDVRDEVLQVLIRAQASKAPVAVADWIAENLPMDRRSIKPCVILVDAWTSKTPVIAAEWVQNLKDPELKRACQEELVESWAASAPESLESWLSSVRNEVSIRKVLDAIIHFRIEAGLDDAFIWALQTDLLDSETRPVFLRRALKKSFAETRAFFGEE